ncbi:MAG TPA: right-handed parallel beta-helix repeat-containing protein [Methylocella sp.]
MKPSVFIAASFAALSGMAFLGTGLAQATTIPATISSTLTISTDSQLTSNVRCTVTGAPCILFGAPGITLKLNGFTMTGNGVSRASCTLAFGETGIDTNGKNNVSIEGPGVVTRFNDIGIVVSGNNSEVEGVAITSSCREGIRVLGSYNGVVGNSVSRASLSGSFFTGIFLSNPGGNNRVLHNEFVGAGPWPTTSSQGGHGIFVGEPGFPSKNNLIQGNNASGNPGAGIFIRVGSTGNTIRHNQALGNVVFDDIFDDNALPANTYDNNLCEVSRIGPSAVNICKVPNIAGHRNGNPDGD